MEISIARARAAPCRGCPIYPHIPDAEFRFPSCELCHWPAIGVGPVHVWRCAYCRHLNQHGTVRPRVTVTMLRLAEIDAAALRLDVADPRYGRYVAPRPRPAGRRRVAALDRAGRPIYARARVDGLPVLIVGGDRPYPHPLGLAEHDAEPCSLGSRATRIACPCDQPAPCLHGQALYAHVVSLPGTPRTPAAHRCRTASELSLAAC